MSTPKKKKICECVPPWFKTVMDRTLGSGDGGVAEKHCSWCAALLSVPGRECMGQTWVMPCTYYARDKVTSHAFQLMFCASQTSTCTSEFRAHYKRRLGILSFVPMTVSDLVELKRTDGRKAMVKVEETFMKKFKATGEICAYPHCGHPEQRENPNNPLFKVCSGCRYVRYCSIECAKANWPAHRLYCKAKQGDESAMEQLVKTGGVLSDSKERSPQKEPIKFEDCECLSEYGRNLLRKANDERGVCSYVLCDKLIVGPVQFSMYTEICTKSDDYRNANAVPHIFPTNYCSATCRRKCHEMHDANAFGKKGVRK